MPGLPFAPPRLPVLPGGSTPSSISCSREVCSLRSQFFSPSFIFLVQYRRRPGNELAQRSERTLPVELTWIVVLTGLSMIPFGWGAYLYLDIAQPPGDAVEVYVVAKQWMWKAQHLDGQAEIDELHVPVGQAVKLFMTSQDVIHDFSVPAFRVKQDVLPGRYTTVWFEANQAGEFHLFCAEYCGMDHSGMVGRIVALEPADFEAWLQSGSATSPAGEGRKLFEQYACNSCHEANRAPRLEGLFGQPVLLTNGQTVVADESYIRESILKSGCEEWPTVTSPLCPHSMVCWTRLRSFSSSRTSRPLVRRSTCRQEIPGSHRFRAQFGAEPHDARGSSDHDRHPGAPEPSYLEEGRGLRSWLLTTDHKRIGILYMISITLMFAFGGSRPRSCVWSCSRLAATWWTRTPTTSCSRCTA